MARLTILISTLVFLVVGISQAWALPNCVGPRSVNWQNCFGSYTYASGNKYVGEYKDGKSHGQGTYTYANGNKYIGEFKNYKRHGQGTDTWGPNSERAGDKYVGEYKDDKMHGQGTYTYANGTKEVGTWENDKMHGQGTKIWPGGDKYVGKFQDGKMHGQGTKIWGPDSLWAGDKYVGEYQDGKMHGQGTHTSEDGEIKEGIWKADVFQYAKKKLSSNNQQISFENVFKILSLKKRKKIQAILKLEDYYFGTIDGAWGAKTKNALLNYTSNNNLDSSPIGVLSYPEVLRLLNGILGTKTSSLSEAIPQSLLTWADNSVCNRAIQVRNGKKAWDINSSYQKYVNEAKRRELSCDVSSDSSSSSSATSYSNQNLCYGATKTHQGIKSWDNRSTYAKSLIAEAKKRGLSCGVGATFAT